MINFSPNKLSALILLYIALTCNIGCVAPIASSTIGTAGSAIPAAFNYQGGGKAESVWLVRYDDVVTATIRTGEALSLELKEKKARVEDALSATRSAVEEGIIPGGGLTLLTSEKQMTDIASKLEGDEKIGAEIIIRSIQGPMKQIAANAGVEGSVIVEKAKTEKPGIGFNASTMVWEDLMQAGIIDPAKVVRSALQNAASIAGMLLTTEVLVTDKPEPEQPMPGAGGMGGMGGGMPGMM